MMKWFWDNFSNPDQRNEIYASPLQASLEPLKGLPPAIVQTAENDVLRDEPWGDRHFAIEAPNDIGIGLVHYKARIRNNYYLLAVAVIPVCKPFQAGMTVLCFLFVAAIVWYH